MPPRKVYPAPSWGPLAYGDLLASIAEPLRGSSPSGLTVSACTTIPAFRENSGVRAIGRIETKHSGNMYNMCYN